MGCSRSIKGNSRHVCPTRLFLSRFPKFNLQPCVRCSQVVPLPGFRASAEGALFHCITCTPSGRVLLLSGAPHVYELLFGDQSGWLRSKCRLIRHSLGGRALRLGSHKRTRFGWKPKGNWPQFVRPVSLRNWVSLKWLVSFWLHCKCQRKRGCSFSPILRNSNWTPHSQLQDLQCFSKTIFGGASLRLCQPSPAVSFLALANKLDRNRNTRKYGLCLSCWGMAMLDSTDMFAKVW